MNTPENGKILILDDDEDILVAAKILLKKYFSLITAIRHPGELKRILGHEEYDVVVLDMNFSPGSCSGKEGLECLDTILADDPQVSVVLITAYADIELAVSGIRAGAIDFVIKPWENEKFIATVMAGLRLSRQKREVEQLKLRERTLSADIEQPFREVIGNSPRLLGIFQLISKIAGTDVNVLILGENGTGKEMIARAIHRASARRDEVFIRVDLGSIPETLFESELFGYVKGAFTDAREDRAGRFEVASGGTLFLDEIGNLTTQLQGKILTAVQSKEIYRVGSNKPVPVEIRLISATNMPLYDLVKEKKFREDLLYRINTVEVNMPPLRDRKEDLPALVDHFVRVYGKKYKKGMLKISGKVAGKLASYSWPGNIRELEHVVERAVIMCENNLLRQDDFLLPSAHETKQDSGELNLVVIEKTAILKALENTNRNLTLTARELGIGRTTLYRKMRKYEIA